MFFLIYVLTDEFLRDEGLNHYLDLVLSNLQILMVENDFDPMPLPNATTGFSKTVCIYFLL